jgi:ribosomal protein S18 acetylase RimI-like enzyme
VQKRDFTIRAMTRQELDIAIDWAAAEGWDPGLYDADCFYTADPDGFLVGLLDDEPVASISVVKYGDSFGFLGFFIVKPEYRGRGFGGQIWEAGLEYLDGRTIGLDAVIAQQGNYQKFGFAVAYRNVRYQATGGGPLPNDPEIVRLSTLPFDEIRAYDRPFFPEDRTRFLRCWIDQPQSTALGILQDCKLAGYGVVRASRSGYKIGPLFADNPELAERVFLSLKSNTPDGASIFLGTPEVSSGAIELATRHNMIPAIETARMYKGIRPDLPLDRVFGVTTFELG